MNKSIIKEQFGANARAYIKSQTHAKGASLVRLVELLQPQADWQVLDIATGAGHTAFAFAPHVATVYATDITPQMLEVTKEQAKRRNLSNVTVEYADADDLPYDEATFDLVTCRIAPHHFDDVTQFIGEATRVLRSGGILAVVDNIVPSGAAGDYINAFEKLRDPSHVRCLSLAEWLAGFTAAGLTIQHHEELRKSVHFEFWAKRHDQVMQGFLRALLTEVSGEAAEFLQVQKTEERTTFLLTEGVILGQK